LSETEVSASAISLSPITRAVAAVPEDPARGESLGPKIMLHRWKAHVQHKRWWWWARRRWGWG
jgi:hypothetical protein